MARISAAALDPPPRKAESRIKPDQVSLSAAAT